MVVSAKVCQDTAKADFRAGSGASRSRFRRLPAGSRTLSRPAKHRACQPEPARDRALRFRQCSTFCAHRKRARGRLHRPKPGSAVVGHAKSHRLAFPAIGWRQGQAGKIRRTVAGLCAPQRFGFSRERQRSQPERSE